jgi:hypothetical protein
MAIMRRIKPIGRATKGSQEDRIGGIATEPKERPLTAQIPTKSSAIEITKSPNVRTGEG